MRTYETGEHEGLVSIRLEGRQSPLRFEIRSVAPEFILANAEAGVLYELPRNPIFPAVHGAFTTWLAPHWKRMPRSPGRNRVNYLSHRAILDAIVDRDPEAAEAALVSHLTSAWEHVRVTFEASLPEDSTS